MIALVDFGIGNLHSVGKALEAVGGTVYLTSDPEQILAADKVVLPGVGAFGDGMAELRARNLIEPLKTVAASQIPFLGICLGMQLLFESADELGDHTGLGLIPGRVRRFAYNELKVPQTGWNQIIPNRESQLLQELESGSYAYFNHSYYCDPTDPKDSLAHTEYGIRYTSVVARDRLYGVQFHPEKSQQVGLKILRNFVENC